MGAKQTKNKQTGRAMSVNTVVTAYAALTSGNFISKYLLWEHARTLAVRLHLGCITSKHILLSIVCIQLNVIDNVLELI